MLRNSMRMPRSQNAHAGEFISAGNEQGMAVLIALIALVILSALGLYMNVNASTELRISDNYESDSRARYAAIAGINHARAVIRGLNFDGLLQGPDGTYSSASSYLTQARTMGFRNLFNWATARSLDITNPSASLGSIPDDGLMNTGKVGTIAGTVIIPKVGMPFDEQMPHTLIAIATARYFIKVTDNSGEASELAGDSTDNPFIDGDNTIIVRSIGVAQTFRDSNGVNLRRNSVAVYEARFMKNSPFTHLDSPMLVIGNDVNANFSGGAFSITGSASGPGVATIDTSLGDGYHPDDIIRTANTKDKGITGDCTGAYAKNCVGDITNEVAADPLQSMMMDPDWFYDLVYNQLPAIADNTWDGSSWNGSGAPDFGTVTNPKITYVDGDMDFTGGVVGAGVLVCTGDLGLGGTFIWDGLVIVVGNGNFWTHGMNNGIRGGVIVANLTKPGSSAVFGTPYFDIRGNSDITTYDSGYISMGAGLISVKQLTFREVTSVIDR
jgi:hypothetical protein